MSIITSLSALFGKKAGQRTRAGRQVIGPSPDAIIRPPARFAWDEKLWTRTVDGTTNVYSGNYRVLAAESKQWRTFQGRIVEQNGAISAFIADPPASIRRHSKGPCFQLTEAPWFRIHWRSAPKTVDGALLYVERLLDECLKTEGRIS